LLERLIYKCVVAFSRYYVHPFDHMSN